MFNVVELLLKQMSSINWVVIVRVARLVCKIFPPRFITSEQQMKFNTLPQTNLRRQRHGICKVQNQFGCEIYCKDLEKEKGLWSG